MVIHKVPAPFLSTQSRMPDASVQNQVQNQVQGDLRLDNIERKLDLCLQKLSAIEEKSSTNHTVNGDFVEQQLMVYGDHVKIKTIEGNHVQNYVSQTPKKKKRAPKSTMTLMKTEEGRMTRSQTKARKDKPEIEVTPDVIEVNGRFRVATQIVSNSFEYRRHAEQHTSTCFADRFIRGNTNCNIHSKEKNFANFFISLGNGLHGITTCQF